jgi:gas vesicle protein
VIDRRLAHLVLKLGVRDERLVGRHERQGEIVMSYEVVDGVRNGARRAWDVTEHAATNAKSGVEEVAQGARSTFFDTLEKVTKVAAAVRAFGLDDALLRVGLQRRRSLFADMGVFGAGFIAGAAVAAISTPLSGRALRRQIAGFLSDVASKGEETVESTVKTAGAQVSHIAHDVRDAAAHKVGDVKQTASHAKEAFVSKVHDITDAASDAAQKIKPEPGTTQARPGNRN